ncbi:aldo/keto reductase [Candidatus Marsarchaeota G1 archaeon OSP_D]|jgi:diketogulonate reductase-like aldo/keto reductase|uniref:Aldo/keto reductase n=3 Tax=Candidatus Marsarchaeota group 1 TaxID=2203770 RepID=A0A2R6AJT2_9ARCH|nr:MAG: aldo/keto reductase [Candidatus Marsarchaeota G1 archaeon OSP_D]PSN86642.1 MAG: aldo/keto reductase [Candidatus Marsarchaeota G1 archaeon BE_D]PSN89087.1 MAG: aldo/keto reductase [Candidatus Marsarchaeota G1 archaeon OSP_C]
MEYKQFGKTGERVSAVGMGTYYDPLWIIGATLGFKRKADLKIEAIRAGIEEGMNLIDTAEIYRSEPLVAKAIKGIKRDELFIATKVWSNHLRKEKLVKALNNSLKRLELNYVDLYQIHFPNSRVPISETMGAMEELVDQGKIRYIGVSNFTLEQMVEAISSLKKYELASTQMSYSLADRRIERDILPYCKKEGIAVLAYYPLAHGKLSKTDKLIELSKKYNKTPAQISLNWLLSRENVFPIPRASNPQHVRENAASTGWTLSEEDLKLLDATFPP